jgi:autotransporter-associated beta strand protein
MLFHSELRRLFHPALKPASRRALRNARGSHRPHLELLEDRVLPAVRLWTGALLGNPNWSQAGNWVQQIAPVAGDVLIFAAGAAQQTNVNDFPSGTRFSQVIFDAGGYNISGQAVTLDLGLVTHNTTGSNTFNPSITLSGREAVLNHAAGSTLTLTGTISLANDDLLTFNGAGMTQVQGVIRGGNNKSGLMTTGTGTLILAGHNSYAGPTMVVGGTLVAAANNALGTAAGGTSVSSHGTLKFQGGVNYSTPEPTHLGGTLCGGSGSNTFNGPIIVSRPGTITTSADGSLALGGNITNVGGLTVMGAGTLTLRGNLASGNGLFGLTVSSSGNTTINGLISGGGGITQQGSGILTLAGNNTYTGTTVVSTGTVVVNGHQPTSSVQIIGTGTLAGMGTVGPILASSGLMPATGIMASGPLTLPSPPAAGGEGRVRGLAATGHVDLGHTTFVTRLNGTAPGTFDQLVVNGPVDLDRAQLRVNLTSASLPAGSVFTILRSTTGQLVGTFSNFPAGSQQTINGRTFRIDYSGGQVRLMLLGTPATVTAVSSAKPSVFGQNVAFPATVKAAASAPAGPTGTANLGTVTLGTGSQASSTTAGLSVSSQVIAVDSSGAAKFTGSPAAPTPTETPVDTTLTLFSSLNPAVFGQPVTVTATVTATTPSAAQPSGTVHFTLDGADVGSCAISAGQATLTLPVLAADTHTLSAVYSGDNNFASSTSAALTQSVTPVVTTTVLASSANPTVFGQSVTFTATVTANNGDTPTGIVDFRDGNIDLGTALLSASGVASLTTATLSVGSHLITAGYAGDGGSDALGLGTLNASGLATLTSGALTIGAHAITADSASDGNFAPSTSGELTQTVNQAATTTTLTASPTTAVFGQPITVVATVGAVAPGAGQPTGSVRFTLDGADVGSCAISAGQATLTLPVLPAGPHTLSAVYSGDSNFASSTSAALTQTILRGQSTTKLTATPAAGVFGQSVTFTATVAAVAPSTGSATGMVTFLDGTTSLGSALLSGGTARLSVSDLVVGSHTITAVYGGDDNFSGSTSAALAQTVDPASTTITLSGTATTTVFGQPVTLTVIVAAVAPGAGTPTGTVNFREGSTTLGSASLRNGAATFTTTTLSVGRHSVTAVYAGDSNFLASTSTALTLTVSPASSSLVHIGNVSVALDQAGRLQITGDAVADQFTVSSPSAGTLRVSGDAGSGTSVNEMNFVEVASTSVTNINVTLGTGVCRATFSGISVPGTISVSYKNASDKISFATVTANGITTSFAGSLVSLPTAPAGSVALDSSTIGTATILIPGTNSEAIRISGGSIGSLSATAGDGTNTISIIGTPLGQATITSGKGSNTVTLSNIAVATSTTTPALSLSVGIGAQRTQRITLSDLTFNNGSLAVNVGDTLVINSRANPPIPSSTLTLSRISGAKDVTVAAGKNWGEISLNTVTACSVNVGTTANPIGDGTTSLTLNALTVTGPISVVAGANTQTVSLTNITTSVTNAENLALGRVADLTVSLGNGTKTFTLSTFAVGGNLSITNGAGGTMFMISNGTVGQNLSLTSGDGNTAMLLDTITVQNQLTVTLSSGLNVVAVDNLTCAFGIVDGGTGGSNVYWDRLGNSGFIVLNFSVFFDGP